MVVDGTASDEFEIANTVFQGTVLGPPLWNVFFSDVTHAADSLGGEPSLFADDLSVFQKFDKHVPGEDIMSRMQKCRERVHSWGRTNRVAFDPSKEHQVILHSIFGKGEPFKLLGCMIDCKLLMHEAIDKIISQMRPKMQAIIRTKLHYNAQDLLSQFKTHVWSIMETHNGGIFHASSSLLQKLDSLQNHFLKEIGIDAKTAFVDHNFAPPSLRRNIGVLGLLQKRVLGKCHPVFQKLLPFHFQVFGRLRPNEHNKQLYGHVLDVENQHALHSRSIFGMVYVYNLLPQRFVDSESISAFQKGLTLIAREKCKGGDPHWMHNFSCRNCT